MVGNIVYVRNGSEERLARVLSISYSKDLAMLSYLDDLFNEVEIGYSPVHYLEKYEGRAEDE